MSHARIQIQDAMVAALVTDVSLATVKAGRVWVYQSGELPVVGVYTNEEAQSLDDGSFDAIGRELELICEVVAQGVDGNTVDIALNAVAVQIEESLGDERHVLGILDCVPAAWSAEFSTEGETVTGKGVMGFSVLYRTAIGSPETII
jgi:hypothetical protein